MAFSFKQNKRNISPTAFSIMRTLTVPVMRRLFSPIVSNPEYMPATGPCFIYGNHSNYFDPFFINFMMTDEPTAGVMTRDQFYKTIPRLFMNGIGIVPTSKYVPDPAVVRHIKTMLDNRRKVVIFPEGGRRWTGKPKPVIESTLKLFWKMRLPVHPVQIHGSYLSWPRWADFPRKSTIEIRWMKPLHPSDFKTYSLFAATCRNQILFEEYSPPETVKLHACAWPAAGIGRLLYRCPETGTSGAISSPDGRTVISRSSCSSYIMDARSRLHSSDGASLSIVDLFEKICHFPMEMNRESVILSDIGCRFHRVDNSLGLIDCGSGYVELTADHISLSNGAGRRSINLEDVHYSSIEQNHKLTVTAPDRTWQLTFNGSSALQWKHYISRLRSGEVPERRSS